MKISISGQTGHMKGTQEADRPKKVLIAGLGNVFHGDEGFGNEVVGALQQMGLPAEFHIQDFRTSVYDLAYALTADYDLKILVEAVRQKSPPGTIYLIEPDLKQLVKFAATEISPQPTDPVSVLLMAREIGDLTGAYYIVGCEPAVISEENEEARLSPVVRAAIPEAVKIILFLAAQATSEVEMPVEFVVEPH